MGDKNIFEGRTVILLLLSELLESTFMAKLKTDLCIPFFVVKHACILKEHCYRSLYTNGSES